MFVGSCAGKLYEFDRAEGFLRWDYDVAADGGQQFHGGFMLSGDCLFVGTDGDAGQLYAFHIVEERVIWQQGLGRGATSDILGGAGRVYAVSLDTDAERLYCLDDATGDILWDHTWPIPGDEWRQFKSPVLVGDTIYFAGINGIVTALDANSGLEKWSNELDDHIVTSITVLGNALYCGGSSTMMYRLRRDDGIVDGTFELGLRPFGPPTPMGGAIVQFTGWSRPGEGAVVALHPDLRGERWRFTLPEKVEGTSARPYRQGPNVLIGTADGQVVALDMKEGRPQWSLRVEGTVRTIRLLGDLAYIGTLEGPLHAIEFVEGAPGTPTPNR